MERIRILFLTSLTPADRRWRGGSLLSQDATATSWMAVIRVLDHVSGQREGVGEAIANGMYSSTAARRIHPPLRLCSSGSLCKEVFTHVTAVDCCPDQETNLRRVGVSSLLCWSQL